MKPHNLNPNQSNNKKKKQIKKTNKNKTLICNNLSEKKNGHINCYYCYH